MTAEDKAKVQEPVIDHSMGELDDADRALAEMGYKPVSFLTSFFSSFNRPSCNRIGRERLCTLPTYTVFPRAGL